MKVHVEFTVDIDPDAWTLNYGISGAREIREDVKGYVEETAIEQLVLVGVLSEKQEVPA